MKEQSVEKINRIIEVVILIMLAALDLLIFIVGKSIGVRIVAIVFSGIIVFMMLIYKRINKRYIEKMLIQLSDMLDTIINMKDKEIFSIAEDTLVSKLQHQTIRLTNILKFKNEELESERNEIKSLISDIAHQLKTPLTNLKMYGEFLQDEEISEEERSEFNTVINVSLDRLIFLVESMIKMSRLEAGVIQVKPKINDLNETVLNVIGQVRGKAEAKKIQITFEELDKIEIYYDKNWICEAILNIIDNAIKYTPINGNVQITIKSYEMFARIDISDDGIGIEEEEMPKIFSRFYRGMNSLDIEGIGIGLYLAREIVMQQGGYIKVINNKSKGTTFSIFLKKQ